MKIIPYLTFNGRCKEAFALYKDVLGGELFSMSFAEAPEDVGMPKDADLIMHTWTFWAERFAMFEDRFGIAWMVNCEGGK